MARENAREYVNTPEQELSAVILLLTNWRQEASYIYISCLPMALAKGSRLVRKCTLTESDSRTITHICKRFHE